MRILQVNNVGSLLGGTLNCALSITKCFPDAKHGIHFVGSRSEEVRESLTSQGIEVTDGTIRTSLLEAYDLVIFHNTSEANFPGRLTSNIVPVYYQHSRVGGALGLRRRCERSFCVSEFLAGVVGMDKSTVLYQPVPKAKEERDTEGPVTVIRYCTPNSTKWPEGMERLYETILSGIDRDKFHFLFVGCPEPIMKRLQAVNPKFGFMKASPLAITLLGHADVLLYDGPEETYGRTVCEAQRSGCFPIVSRSGGFVEQIEDNKTGNLCSSAGDFVQALSRFQKWKSPEIRETLRIAGDSRGSYSNFRKRFLSALKGEK